MTGTPTFAVIPGSRVHQVLGGHEAEVTGLVEETYRTHGEAGTLNPASYFLRFPDRPSSRIIALPASIRDKAPVHGLKWISSFPENLESGLPRASAVLILNDADTGYPFACLEASIISAARTAASAALAALRLSESRGVTPRRVGFVGAGFIARYIHTYLAANGLEFDAIGVFDLKPEHTAGFAGCLAAGQPAEVTRYDRIEQLIEASDLVVFATVAGEPHVTDPALFAHNPLVLHVSLRDLAPEVIASGYNVVDDVDHCLTANTSPHLAEQLYGDRDFLAGTLYDVLNGTIRPPADQPVFFSPFGLGVLDLALGRYVYGALAAAGQLETVPGFFHDLSRFTPAGTEG
ncbi:MAG TPA: 2,3-diaminopropionate biosynthesis protein SbnB [Actinocrinis sp.]|nr:2,3-diaminopropionate biosynthesis protein SbnB [Actinocrinis sp.]